MRLISVLNEQTAALRWVLGHPLNRGNSGRAFLRWLVWHLRVRLLRSAKNVVPFIGNTRLLGGRALTTVNIQHYVGLGELDVMGFLLHLLQPDDLMIDVGANVGAISVMAGGIGARAVAIEPVPESFGWLQQNVALNDLGSRIDTLNVAVGERSESVMMSSGRGAGNHIALDGSEPNVECLCATLDRIVAGRPVTVVKIDVEGFEVPVVRGGTETWAQPSLKAVVAELKGHGNRYGYDENEAVAIFAAQGFTPFTYEALTRRLTPLADAKKRPDNLIFVRDPTSIQQHLLEAPRRPVIWNRVI